MAVPARFNKWEAPQPGEKPSRRVNLCSPAGLKIFGSGGRDRTADKRIMIPLLYQLSYAAMSLNDTTMHT